MTVTINGEAHRFDAGMTLAQILERLGYVPNAVSVALNATFIPRTRHTQTTVKDGDALDMVAPRQGG